MIFVHLNLYRKFKIEGCFHNVFFFPSWFVFCSYKANFMFEVLVIKRYVPWLLGSNLKYGVWWIANKITNDFSTFQHTHLLNQYTAALVIFFNKYVVFAIFLLVFTMTVTIWIHSRQSFRTIALKSFKNTKMWHFKTFE